MVLIVILFSVLVMYKINNALVRLEFKQEALCYDIYVLDKAARREEQAFLQEAGVKI